MNVNRASLGYALTVSAYCFSVCLTVTFCPLVKQGNQNVASAISLISLPTCSIRHFCSTTRCVWASGAQRADGNCGSHFPPLCHYCGWITFCLEDLLFDTVICPRQQEETLMFPYTPWNWQFHYIPINSGTFKAFNPSLVQLQLCFKCVWWAIFNASVGLLPAFLPTNTIIVHFTPDILCFDSLAYTPIFRSFVFSPVSSGGASCN